jgi:hypothetical protein
MAGVHVVLAGRPEGVAGIRDPRVQSQRRRLNQNARGLEQRELSLEAPGRAKRALRGFALVEEILGEEAEGADQRQ